MKTDRIFGLVMVFGALAMFAGALQIQTSFLSDPLGPKAFPILIAVVGCLSGLSIAIKPDAEPDWPDLRSWMHICIALAVMIAYAMALKPLAFLLPTAFAAAVISFQINPDPKRALITGSGLSIGLFIVFKYGLGLGLVALPKSLGLGV
jgi:putative tricarboxylic transport membrane protein